MNRREPTLDELLREPIIRQIMASDGVKVEDIRRLMQSDARRRHPARVRQA